MTIECEVKNGYALMSEKSTLSIKKHKGQPAVLIERKSFKPVLVACPHFTKLMKKAAPGPEPE